MANVSLDKDMFFRRMKRLYAAWKDGEVGNDDSFSKMDCLVSAIGTNEDVDNIYSKSTALQIWLLNYVLTDTIMLLAKESINFLASGKKIEFLRKIENQNTEDIGVPPVKLFVRDKGDENKANFAKLIEVMKQSKKGKTLGVFSKENCPNGSFIDAWRAALKNESFDTVDVSAAVAFVMCPKEDSEIITIKKACLVLVDVFTKYLKNQIMEIIDSNKKVKHSELAKGVNAAMTNKKYVTGVDVTQVDICYPAVIQSGGNYPFNSSGLVSDESTLHFGVIICWLGASYKSYCSNIVRTLLVNPTKTIEENYNFLLQLQEEILKKLVAGTKVSEVYKTGIKFVKDKKPEMLNHLTKTFGFAMGIEFVEKSLLLGPKIHAILKKGMVFNVNVGLVNLTNPDATDKEGKTYALFIGDTVIVNEDQSATNLTPSNRKVKDIGIYVKDEKDEEEEGSGKENERKLEILVKEWLKVQTCPQCRERTTSRMIHRTYLNFSNNNSILEDIASLQQKMKELQNQLVNLTAQVPKLICNELKDEIKFLKQQRSDANDYKKKNEILKSNIGHLKKKLSVLSEENKELEEKYKNILFKFNYVTKENKILSQECVKNKKLEAELIHYKDKIISLQDCLFKLEIDKFNEALRTEPENLDESCTIIDVVNTKNGSNNL